MANKIIKEIGKGFEIIGERLATIDQRLDVLEADSGGTGGPDFYGDTTMNETELKNRFKALETQVDAQRKFMKAVGVDTPETDFHTAATNIGLALLGGLPEARQYACAALENRGFGDYAEKVLSEGAGSGGVLVPEVMQPDLISLIAKFGVFRRYAKIVPMGSASVSTPKITADLTIYAPGEGGDITLSDCTLENVQLNARKLCGLCAVTSELTEDSIVPVAQAIGESFARSISKAEDLCGFAGDGTAQFFGFSGISAALLAVDASIANIKSLVVGSGNTYAELVLGDFDKVVGQFPDDWIDGAAWYMNRHFFYNTVMPLARTAGLATIKEVLTDQKQMNLLGFPLRFTGAMPKVEADSQVVAVLANLGVGAMLGQRRENQIDVSGDVYFSSDKIAIRTTERIDINVHGVGDTTDPGPVCGLITAAS